MIPMDPWPIAEKVKAWFIGVLIEESPELALLKTLIRSAVSLVIVIPIVKLLQFYIEWMNHRFDIEAEPLPFMDETLLDVLVPMGDLAIVLSYVINIFFGITDVVVSRVHLVRASRRGRRRTKTPKPVVPSIDHLDAGGDLGGKV